MTGPSCLFAQVAKTFFIPLPEEQLQQNLNSFTTAGNNMETVVSITITEKNTIIYYDHWEDGYEADVLNPVQPTTLIWGDSDPSNGMPPGYAIDQLGPGNVISLRNTVPVPRNPSVIFYDGKDKLLTEEYLVLAKANWATNPGSVMSGSVEVYDTLIYGNRFIVPIGEDTPGDNEMFENTSLYVMASEDNTQVQLDVDADGIFEITTLLNQGENYFVSSGVLAGAEVLSDKGVQAHLITGDRDALFETRWFGLYGSDLWDDVYYTPIGTTSANNVVAAFFYNPNNTPITVNATFFAGTETITVPANGSVKYQMPFNSGAEFRSQNGEHFFVVSTVDSDPQTEGNTSYEWGFALLPEIYLSSSASIGWGPGTADIPPTANGSPVWVTATETTLLYIDYDGDPLTGPNVDPNGKRYDLTYELRPYESYRIYDPDHDATGMLIYNLQGNRMAMVWGEDPATAFPGNPYLDLGFTVQPIRRVELEKFAILLVDQNGDGLVGYDDILEYTVRVNNRSFELFENYNLRDTLPTEVEYIANTTFYNGVAVPDDVLPLTIYPADEMGVTLDTIFPHVANEFTYRVRVRDPLTNGLPFFSSMTNKACLRSPNDELICTEHTVPVVSPTKTDCALNFIDETGNSVVNYAEGASVCVRVNDGDQNMDMALVDTVWTRLFNLNNGDYEDVKLSETGVNTGVFEKCINSSPAGGQMVNDGVLFAAANEDLQAEYIDVIFGEACIANISVVPPLQTKSLYLSDPAESLDRISPADVQPVDVTTVASPVLGEIETNFSSSPNIPVPDSDPTGVVDIINVSSGGTITDLNVTLTMTHGFVGDLLVTLTHVETGTQVVLLDRPGFPNSTFGCPGDNLNVIFDDAAATLAENECSLISPAISGDFIPNSNLAAFNGEDMSGNWSLNVSDVQGQDIGTLDSWGLEFTLAGIGSSVSVIDFVQTPAMCSNLEIPNGGGVGVFLYINEISGSFPANPDMTAILRYGATTLATLTNPVYNSTTGILSWAMALPAGGVLPAGQAATLEVLVNEKGYLFEILYDSDTAPSRVDIETSTVISVDEFAIYDAPYAGGSTIIGATNGDVVYVRATVSDPFGTYDINGVDLAITNPFANTTMLNLGAAEEVNNAGCSITYEYVWMTPHFQGLYHLQAVAHEGFENTVVDSASTEIILQFDDLGTDCGLLFQDNTGTPMANFNPNVSQICVQVVDFDQDVTAVIDVIPLRLESSAGDVETINLTETAAETGVFVGCINFSSTVVGAAGDNELYGPQGNVLTATYIDPDNMLDVCTQRALVNSLIPEITILKSLQLPNDGIAQVGDTVVFEIEIGNPGTTNIDGFTVSDAFNDACLSFRSASVTPANSTASSLEWTEIEFGTLASGASTTLIVVFDAVSTCGNTQNVVSVNGSDEFGSPVADGPSNAAVTITDPSLNVSKTLIDPAASPYYPNDTLTYQIEITNDGSTDIAVLPVSDFFNTNCLEFVDANVPADGVGGGTALWGDLGALAVGNTVALSTRFRVKCGCNQVDNMVNIAFAEDVNGDDVPPVSDDIFTPITFGMSLAVNDMDTTVSDMPSFPLVLENDSHTANDVISIVGVGTDASNGMSNQGGTISINANGTPLDTSDDFISYTPPLGYLGFDDYLYQIQDPCGALDTASVVVRIFPATENCSNGIDDDMDGLVDCDDPDCAFTASIIGDCTGMEVLNPQPGWAYQWYYNATSIVGATSSTYVPVATSAGDYHAVVTSAGGCTFTTNVITTCCDPTMPTMSGN